MILPFAKCFVLDENEHHVFGPSAILDLAGAILKMPISLILHGQLSFVLHMILILPKCLYHM